MCTSSNTPSRSSTTRVLPYNKTTPVVSQQKWATISHTVALPDAGSCREGMYWCYQRLIALDDTNYGTKRYEIRHLDFYVRNWASFIWYRKKDSELHIVPKRLSCIMYLIETVNFEQEIWSATIKLCFGRKWNTDWYETRKCLASINEIEQRQQELTNFVTKWKSLTRPWQQCLQALTSK